MTVTAFRPQSATAHPRGIKGWMQELATFWKKVTNDWIMQLAGMLAYNFLTSLFPLLLVILAAAGFVIGTISPGSQAQLQHALVAALPAGIGAQVVQGALNNLNRSAGLILIIGILGAIFSGSRLFIAIENCTSIIFRLRGRNPIPQNIMAIGMTLLYVVLVPLIFTVSALPLAILNQLGLHLPGVLSEALGLVVGLLAVIIFFSAIYIIVPNRPVVLKEVWKGSLVAGILFVLYELFFPLYTSVFLRPNNYGSLAGFALVILVFFYYLAFILLLGMEVNSWAQGQRETASDVQAIMHEVQAHSSIRQAQPKPHATASRVVGVVAGSVASFVLGGLLASIWRSPDAQE
jgi:YihY family inner membrane protein